jgi:hypothetical protein
MDKRPRKSVILEGKMGVLRELECVETRPTAFRDLNTAPSTVTIIMKNADEMK